MVESQQEQDDNPYYGPMGDDDEDADDLPAYLTNDYLDQCMLYQSEDPDRLTSALSNYSRPISRYD